MKADGGALSSLSLTRFEGGSEAMAKICGFEIESWGEKSEEGRTGFLSLWARLFILSGPCADVIRPVSLFTKN